MSTPPDGRVELPSGGEWVPMSPNQIRRTRLREAGLARRGYRPEDVELLVSRLALEVERWMDRCGALQGEVHRLRNYYREQGESLDAPAPRRTGPSPEAVQVLARAQAYADQIVADAQAQARSLQSEARTSGEAILARARLDAEQAAQSYRARAGTSYSPDREETERLAAWARSILATMEGVQKQLAATGQAFALELAKFSRPPAPSPDQGLGQPIGLGPAPSPDQGPWLPTGARPAPTTHRQAYPGVPGDHRRTSQA
jgi:cell division septum initiation protein DivIVA